MEKTKIVKQACVFLIIALITVSPGIVLANTTPNDIQIKTYSAAGTTFGAPNLTVENYKGGFGISAVVKNVGDALATNISWNMDLVGKMIFFGDHSTGLISSLAPGDTAKIKTGLILALGKIYINTTATCAEGATYSEEGTAIMLLFFAVGVSEPLP
jgi:hypothetical protein